jgi:hypothetical protein
VTKVLLEAGASLSAVDDEVIKQQYISNIVFSIFKDIQLQFSLSWHEKKSFFVTNLFKINIFSFSSITRLKRDPLFVFKYCFIFIVLGQDTSEPGSSGGIHRGDKGSNGGRGLSQILLKLTFSHSVQSHD